MAAPESRLNLLKPALAAIQADVDASFDALLPIPGDPRDRLV